MKQVILALLLLSSTASFAAIEKAILAGGCFWCMEPPLEALPGVVSVVSGYSGGHKSNPTYDEVSSGTTGHIEVVEVSFDPSKVSFEKILEVYWRNIDPLDARGQFCDKGEQYTSGIFFNSTAQELTARKTLEQHARSTRFKGQQISTFIRSAGTFYPAEAYHQDFYKKNPVRYKFYRYNCGRDKRLDDVWGNK